MNYLQVDSISDLQALNGYEGLLVLCKSTNTIYRYYSNLSNLMVNGISVLSTSAGGNTRWVGISGKYQHKKISFYASIDKYLSVNSISDLISLGAYNQMIVFCKSLETIYQFFVGVPAEVNGLTVINSSYNPDGKWIAIYGKYVYEDLNNIFNIVSSTSTSSFTGITVRDEYILLSSTVTELNFVGDSFQAVLDSPNKVTISFGSPPPPANNIINFTITPSVAEIGSSVVGAVFNWSVVQTPDSQSITPLIGPIPNNLLTYTYSGSITSDTTFTLTNVVGSNTSTKNASIAFRRKRYWFASTNDDFANGPKTYADLLLDSGFSSKPVSEREEFATSRQTTKTFDATGGRYLYIMFPESFGTVSPQLQVGPFPVTLSYVNIIPFTNQSGHTENYYVYRTNLQTGSSITVQVL